MSELADHQDLKDLFLGEKLGEGVFRSVYVYRPDPSYVIKVSEGDPVQNVVEFRIWDELSETKYKKWLAPCRAISRCGIYLLQRRVEYRDKKQYPDKIPSFFTDMKYSNFGWYDGRFVCCDYGGFVLTNGFTSKMRKAEWWE